jgi:two-component system phosphate regulon response regulator PhoB
MVHVLVVEDEADVAELLSYNLRAAGYGALVASTGREAIELAEAKSPDIILLDLMLPDIPGMQVCRALKSKSATRDIPVVIVSARSDEIDRVVGFEVGADDYVVKPYSTRELLLRVRRSLERHHAKRNDGDVLRSGAIKMEIGSHRVWVAETLVELRVTEFKLLRCLCEKASTVLSRERLRDVVWGAASKVALRTVDAHVKRLRDRLGVGGNQIETVRGVGYRMMDDRAARSLTPTLRRTTVAGNGVGSAASAERNVSHGMSK